MHHESGSLHNVKVPGKKINRHDQMHHESGSLHSVNVQVWKQKLTGVIKCTMNQDPDTMWKYLITKSTGVIECPINQHPYTMWKFLDTKSTGVIKCTMNQDPYIMWMYRSENKISRRDRMHHESGLWWWSDAVSVDILGTSCDQCRSTVQ